MARGLDGWNPAASLKIPALGAWQLVPGPLHLIRRPCLLPLHPVAMGTSILQLIELLARCLSFSFYLERVFPFISWALRLHSPGAQTIGKGHLLEMKLRLQTPEPSDATHVPEAQTPPPLGSTSKRHPVA